MARSNTEAFDIKGGEAQASPDVLARLRKAIAEGVKLHTTIEGVEADLARLKGELHRLRTGRIPDIMAEIQSDDFTHQGWRIKVNDFVSGSLPKDPKKREKAIAWLEKNGGASLIQTFVSVAFPRSQRKTAMEIAKGIEKKGLAPEVETSVHSSTLKAFARERMENGDPIDFATLGLYSGKLAEFTPLDADGKAVKKKGGKKE